MPKSRPHHWHTQLKFGIEKTLRQPWFEPFTSPPSSTAPEAFGIHRQGLKKVLRRDRHDRPDIWYVLPDGSNLDEVMGDLVTAAISQAVPLLDRMHNPCELLRLIESGRFVHPDSPLGRDLAHKARQACASLGIT